MSRSKKSKNGVVVRALHKSGSMFLYHFFAQVAQDAGLPYYSINHADANEHEVEDTIETGFCVCPIRDFAQNRLVNFPNLDRVTQIFHLRDPRDILVSEYFSLGWIHPDQNWTDDAKQRRREIQAMPIDQYVLNQHELSPYPIADRFAPLMELELDSPDIIVSRYETMVTRFYRWALNVIVPFEFSFNAVWAAKYAWKFRNEFQVSQESMTHKRNVTPGDHRVKLKPATIAILNQRFAPILTRFGYLGETCAETSQQTIA